MNKTLVLVVEDDKAVRNLLGTALELNNYQCRSAETGRLSIQEVLSYKPQIIILDLGLPDMDGMDVLKKIRSWSNVPIVVVSARGEDKDKIDAFDAGADDYVTKPFSIDELLARLRAALRRAAQSGDEREEKTTVFQNGALKIDYAAGCAFMNAKELHLTPLEYKLLCLLAKNMGKVVTHHFILKELWGKSGADDSSHVRVFMATLRKKIEGSAENAPKYIQTHIGVGYRMVAVE